VKKIGFGLFLLLFPLLGHAAVPRNKLSLGVVIGDPLGPSVKYWMDSTTAVDFGIGFDNDPVFYADVLWHSWTLLPRPTSGDLGLYAGLGPRYEAVDNHDDEVGIRVPLGITYLVGRAPIEFFAELVPVFEVSPDTDSELDAGIGVRFGFGGFPNQPT